MPANASSELLTALKASLANSSHGWTVAGVAETTSTRLSAVTVTGSVSGSVSGGGGIIDSSAGGSIAPVTGSTTGSTSSTNTSETKATLSVQLQAANLRGASGGALRLNYVSTQIGGAFASAVIRQDGAELTSTDSALDATMRTLAGNFQAARDAAMVETFSGAAVAAGPSPPSASVGLIAALKMSLADDSAAWSVQGGATNIIKEPSQPSPDEPIKMVPVRIERSVTMASPLVRVAVGAYGPLVFCYTGVTTPEGVYQSGTLFMDGKSFATTDAELHATIMAVANTSWTAADAAITASLTHGPQTNAELAAARAA